MSAPTHCPSCGHSLHYKGCPALVEDLAAQTEREYEKARAAGAFSGPLNGRHVDLSRANNLRPVVSDNGDPTSCTCGKPYHPDYFHKYNQSPCRPYNRVDL